MSTNNLKALCEEYFNTTHNEELLLKILTKFVSILKISEKFQKDLFINLSDKGLNKLLNALRENNEDLRKASCKVLLELLYNNEVLQNIFCEKFNFNPIGNIICINWLPKYLKENIKIDEKVLMEIKNSYNLDGRGLKYWMWPQNNKYTDEKIPDPQKYLLGFYYANKNVRIILFKYHIFKSFYNVNVDDKLLEERLDTRLLTTKLENENFENDKFNYVVNILLLINSKGCW